MPASASSPPTLAPAPIPTDAQLRRQVFWLALPVAGEQLLYMLVGMVDLMIAGRLADPTPVQAGLSIAMLLSWLTSTIFSAVSVGSTAIVARATGAGDRPAAEAATRQSLLLAVVGGALAAVLNVAFADQIMHAMGLTGEAAAFGAEWLRITGVAWLPASLNIVGAACLRGAGDTRTPLVLMAGVNAINLLLALVLTFGIGGWEGMGAAGIAWATAVARTAGGLAMPLIMRSGATRLTVTLRPLSPDMPMIRRILRVGLPGAAETFVGSLGMTFFYRVIASLPDAEQAVAAHGMAVRTEGLSYLPGFGFAVAAATLVGQGLGAGRPEVAERAARQAFLLGLGVMSAMALVFLVAAEPMVGLFAPGQPAVVAAAAVALQLSALAQPGQAAAFIFSGSLRGAGDTHFPLLSTFVGLLLVRVPASILLAFALGLGLPGAWLAMALDLTVRGALTAWRFSRGAWKRVEV